MEIETVSDLANQVGDWVGVYGCCKAAEKGLDHCEESEKNTFCCRIGFTMEFEERIRKAVENEKQLEQINIK